LINHAITANAHSLYTLVVIGQWKKFEAVEQIKPS